MDRKTFLKEIAQENLSCYSRMGYMVGAKPVSFQKRLCSAYANTFTYWDSTSITMCKPDGLAQLELNNLDSIVASEKLIKEQGSACVLNFASAKHPGGGFINGSSAQEETICYKTTLYDTLARFKQHYELSAINTNHGLYGNWAMYTPDVVIFRDDKLEFKMPSICSIITCPAVNAGVARKNKLTENLIYKTMRTKCELVLCVAIRNGERNLVLGAFGCGVFKNNPQTVALIFKTLLLRDGYIKYFDKVVFACYGTKTDTNYLTFKNVFNLS